MVYSDIKYPSRFWRYNIFRPLYIPTTTFMPDMRVSFTTKEQTYKVVVLASFAVRSSFNKDSTQ